MQKSAMCCDEVDLCLRNRVHKSVGIHYECTVCIDDPDIYVGHRISASNLLRNQLQPWSLRSPDVMQRRCHSIHMTLLPHADGTLYRRCLSLTVIVKLWMLIDERTSMQ